MNSLPAAQAPEEELIYSLPGFSVQSGIKVGQAYKPPEVNQTDIEPLNVLFQSSIPGNNSQFTICLRLKAHYQRPETVLMSAYVENKTAILIGKFALCPLAQTRKVRHQILRSIIAP